MKTAPYVWSADAPTSTGWWWHRRFSKPLYPSRPIAYYDEEPVFIISIETHGPHRMAVVDGAIGTFSLPIDGSMDINCNYHEWAGPIPMPASPATGGAS